MVVVVVVVKVTRTGFGNKGDLQGEVIHLLDVKEMVLKNG